MSDKYLGTDSDTAARKMLNAAKVTLRKFEGIIDIHLHNSHEIKKNPGHIDV